MSAGRQWTYEVHELSSAYSAVVYNEHGLMVADHLDEPTASLIAAAPDLYSAVHALLGLVKLIRARNDLPADLMTSLMPGNHRVQEAEAALAKVQP